MDIGGIRVRAAKAKKCPYKMGRALLPEFFTPDELKMCSTVGTKAGRKPRPQADSGKLQSLIGTYISHNR